MTILIGSRYQKSVLIPVVQSDGTRKLFLTPRFGLTPDDLPIGCTIHTYTEGERLEDISMRYYNRANAWWIIAELNGILYPYKIETNDPTQVIRLAIPPLSFVLSQLGE